MHNSLYQFCISRTVSTDLGQKFTILRVNSKLVDAKNLNKYFKKILKKSVKREEFRYLLNYTVSNMPQALDDLNLLTILIIMSKLDIRDQLLFNSILPFLYKINDFNKIIECLLYSSMLFKDDDNLKLFATKLIFDLPSHLDSINYNNISKLCESLCFLNLYSEEFASLISTLVDKKTLARGEIEMLNFSSILNYLSRVRSGDEAVWSMYANYSLNNLLTTNYKPVIKLLQSFVNRNIHHKVLFRNCGDFLVKFIDHMHPKDVSNLSYLYFKVNHPHYVLFNEIFKVGEMITTNLDGISSLRLLSGYYLYHSSLPNLLSHTISGPGLLQNQTPLHHYRTVYLIYNNISRDLNSFHFEDFLLLFKTLELFKFINTKNLQVFSVLANLTFLSFPANVDKSLLSNLDLVRLRYKEKKLINTNQQSFIRLLIS
ncbi:uncharacterized protein TA16290 [Theileria annulata]|uniref:Uncharacterized protein n=1 Tax=Theileria annulata TaxID=5874 RepID=Q4UIT7_THEAN|nr:uncharacterized protein TA16290 [Theileria annulata]CAI73002.1 hypothetical protein, conserved [Theileria annulata]|eukprot:XP_953680.1 hypothetical protein, conserved [Theileria annulata]